MREVIGFIGRALITVGLLVLGFVAYQLWGTNVFANREQDQLKSEFQQQLKQAPPPTTAPGAPADARVPPPEVVAGDALGIMRIPRIGVDQVVVSGINRDDLRKGPGHYPETPLPGQLGNVAIAGHRTTYGAPFYDLDQLEVGDQIEIQTLTGTYTYAVADKGVVKPSDVSVVANTPGSAMLTLTTCNPRYSAKERLYVKAGLVPDRSSTLVADTPSSESAKNTAAQKVIKEEGLSGDPGERAPALLWGLILAAVGGVWWFWFHRYHRWWIWFAGAVPFVLVLFVFYSHIERSLPAAY